MKSCLLLLSHLACHAETAKVWRDMLRIPRAREDELLMGVGAPRLPRSNQDDRTGTRRGGVKGKFRHVWTLQHDKASMIQRKTVTWWDTRWIHGAGVRASRLGLRSAQLPTLPIARNSTLPLSHSGLSSVVGSVFLCHHYFYPSVDLAESIPNLCLSFPKIGSCLRLGIANLDYNKDVKRRNNTVYRA